MAISLQEKQINALKRMLNFNQPITKATNAEPQWKVLIYDRFGQDIISPLLTIKELRDMGVTLHLSLHSDRDPIPDVPAIYFVMPTEDNIQRLCRDFQNQLYESYYLNFISAISRQKLEDIAQAALQANAVQQVCKVFDQYLNFISLENELFTLRHQDRDSISYYAINKGDVKDTEMDVIMESIVDSLFSVFVTMGVVPIIRCPKGNAAEMVAEKLDKKLRENLRDTRNSLFTSDGVPGQFSFQRPLLVILDRNLDMATMLHHTWTYQALAHDVLDLKLNRIEIEEIIEDGSHASSPARKPRTKKKVYDLSARDKMWMAQKGHPFPEVAEAVQEELNNYRQEEGEVKKLKAALGLEGEDDTAISMLSDNTARLTSAVTSLPELLEKKRLIDMHMNIATALLEQIKARKLDTYFETEEKMMSRASLNKSLMDIISDPEAGKPEDKVRLFIIALICGPPMSEAEIDQYCVALQGANCDISAVQYVRRWKSYSKLQAPASQYTGGGISSTSMFSGLLSKGSQFVMEGVKNLVVKGHNLPATRIVDALMDLKSLPDSEDFRYFDPKLLRADATSVPRNKTPFQEAYVFIVGGGNYIEFQNLMDYVKSKSTPSMPKKIVYGCSDLVNASQFLKQLSHLGQEI
ncbi:sec1 family domain-containing protein 1 [Biomphalaria glabrata]|uniref:Sec1 family domain-containing protein 1-like n=1 Tax=Biomphalaria glabrata TaxID=6526 RepID=A0A2C9K4M4_BIOGL|nr:sec1 family domain-containing protein 1-like [Biomphalaria glabrata]KAI8781201.1 sec1 family domain-containing protein 1 [Biomphalaria glabrata]